MAKAMLRCLAEKVSARIACSLGCRPPPPAPCMIRKKISIGRLVARAQKNELRVKMASGAVEPRPAETCCDHKKCAPGHRPWDGSGGSTVEHRTGGNFVPLAHGDSI